MKQDDPQFKFRMPPELKQELENEAKNNTRTLGAEIVARLEVSLAQKSVWAEFGEAERLKRDYVQSARIKLLTQMRADMAYGVLILKDCLDGKTDGVSDEETARLIELFVKQANEAIEDANKDEPEQLIADLRAAVDRSRDLQARIGPGGYLPPSDEHLAAESKKIMVGNLGRVGDESADDGIREAQEKLLDLIRRTQPPVPPPVRLSKGPTPSKNARKPVPKKR